MSDYLDFLQKNVPVAEDTETGKQAVKSKVTAKAENTQTGIEADNTPISKDPLLDMSQANMGFSMLAPEQKKNYETGEKQEPQPLQGGAQTNNPALEATNMGSSENLNIQTPTNPIAGGNNLTNPILAPNIPKQKVSESEIYDATPLPAVVSYSDKGQFEIRKADKNNKTPTMGLYMVEVEGETLLQIAEKASKWLGKTISAKDLISYNYMALSGFSETTPLAKDGTLWLSPEPNEPNTAVKIERIVPVRPVKKSIVALAPENMVAQDAINDNVPTLLLPAGKNDISEIEAFTIYLKAIEINPKAEVPTFLEDVASLWTASVEIARLDKSLLYYVADVGAPAALWAMQTFTEDIKIFLSGTDWEGTEKSRLWSLLWIAAEVFGVGVMCKFTSKLAIAASRSTGKLGKPAFELIAKASERAGDIVKLSDDKINAGLAYFTTKTANAGADLLKIIDETIANWLGAADNLALEGVGGVGKMKITKLNSVNNPPIPPNPNNNINQIPANTNQVPANTNQIPANTNQVPANTNQIPANTNQVPANTNQVPANTNQNTNQHNLLPHNQIPVGIDVRAAYPAAFNNQLSFTNKNAKGHLLKHSDVLGFLPKGAPQFQKRIVELEAAATNVTQDADMIRVGIWDTTYPDVTFFIKNNVVLIKCNQTNQFISVFSPPVHKVNMAQLIYQR